jgi:hypothetical protein
MDLLAAIKREERKLEKQLGKLKHRLNGVRAAGSFGRFDRSRTNGRKEEGLVGGSSSRDCKGGEKAVGGS